MFSIIDSYSFALAGTIVGGFITDWFQRKNAMLFSVLMMSVGVSLYIPVGYQFSSHVVSKTSAIIVIALESFLSAIGTVVLFAVNMDCVRIQHSGSDYTVLACVIVIVSAITSILGGFMAQALGYPLQLLISAILTLAGGLVSVHLYRINKLFSTPNKNTPATPSKSTPDATRSEVSSLTTSGSSA